MLEAVNVAKAYDGRPVIRDFSARFVPGSHTCLMGPSGCGKTTLLRLLMGLEAPDSGQIRIPEGTRFSAVFQEDRLLNRLTAAANVRLAARASIEQAGELLLELGIPPESLSQPVSTFSGGMKRRVALCRALLAEYDVLTLDEPYKGLDEDTRARVMRLVDVHTRGRTVILVTHAAEEAMGYDLIHLPCECHLLQNRSADTRFRLLPVSPHQRVPCYHQPT